MKAIVVGAGVGGLTAALALRARGIEVEVLESAPGERTSGGGLGVACNASKVLRALGVDLAASGVGRVCERFSLRTPSGKPMRELPIASIAVELGAPVVNVRRHDLITALRAALGDTAVHYGANVVGFDRVAGGVTAITLDGRMRSADVLVGADGIRSVVRGQLFGPEPVNEYGYVCWIATVPFTHPNLPPGAAAHYWGRGKRFGLLDIGGGDAYWWGTMNVPAGRRSGGKPEVLRCFDGWAPEVVDIVRRTPPEDIVAVPAQDRAFRDQPGEGPVTLVGDAAHPMLTSLSQGAGSAIEDGYHLAHALAAADHPVTGLRAYERARRDRVRALVAASRRLSRVEQLANPLAVALRDLAIKHAPRAVVRRGNLAPMRYDLPA
ncbi:FAD-dependent monooxygenase [Actinokineospora auranticolor]|uniref:2-polyprenyl-6-methoxyphenol hydroxylase-like FAD-dependent oxidoreductase n=1 Tax=Actinokineospora auranticolor TaxID=155976 RepID=A0A2S6H1U8_9PSEU|nr:FAD-dependent monooxygenase [Actinokineospora auranticolor]PPK71459.1 2-polyprenyl-6-methoxyphenol hydroxylase-like FAD-dependent oxidoreductase [Actinokineospora auranticolor]